MKVLNILTEENFLKYRETPVKLKPYKSKQMRIANLYIKKLEILLAEYSPRLQIRGSTFFKILGKGEVEIGVYPKVKDWKSVLAVLTKTFGEPKNLEKNYARFNDFFEEKDIEIIALKGYEASVDIKLHEFLKSRPTLLKKYEEVKKKYSFSKREYQRQKNTFLTKVIQQIPD